MHVQMAMLQRLMVVLETVMLGEVQRAARHPFP